MVGNFVVQNGSQLTLKQLHSQYVEVFWFILSESIHRLFVWGVDIIGLTLCIPTTHICVENTVLASMNCFLFNLSYNVMIMCEWHQLMYIAIITPSKPTTPPDFRCISPIVWQQSPKCQFFGQITTPKITLIYRQFLIQIIRSKMKSLHLQQTSRSDLGI